MFRRTVTFLIAAVAAVMVAACTTTGTPTPQAVNAIQTACTADAALRPTVTALLAIPGLATPQEVTAVTAARAVIDPVCANPSAPVAANVQAALAASTGNIVAIVTELQVRKTRAASSPA
jgi:hypothetical protein